MDIKKLARTLLMALAGLTVVAFAAISSGTAMASPGFVTEDLSGALTPDDLANTLVGAGVSISNVTYAGADVAAGKFSGGTGIIDYDAGVILSSGNIVNVVGPNVEDGKTGVNGTPGDADLDALSGFTTFDAAVLEFDFVPDADTVYFQYVFASDEYNEYVNSPFNDTFAFFINGANCALTPGTGLPVGINTINNGNPYGSLPNSHPELYINNDLSDGGGAIDTEMDGLTVTLTCQAAVIDGGTNHIKLAIADASDQILDAVVFLKEGSFSTTPPDVVEVGIDVKPNSDPNSHNCGRNGNLPVAILGSADFDATTVDVSTVVLAGAVSALAKSGIEDVNGDGYLDIVIFFLNQEVSAAIGCPLDKNTLVEVAIEGETTDGVKFVGSDVLRIAL